MARQKLINQAYLYGPLVVSQFFGKGLGAFKDLFIATFLGISVYTDIYFLFLAVPGYLVTLFASPIISLLIPDLAQYDEVDQGGKAYGYLKFFSRFSFLTTTILLIVGASYLNWFREGAVSFEWFCLVLMCSILPFSCSGQVLISYLSLKKDYKRLAVFTVLNALVSFLAFVLLVSELEHWALPLSFALGFFVEGGAAFLYLKYKTRVKTVSTFELFKGFSKEYSALIFSAIFLGSATLIDNFMIAKFGESGGVTSYSFGIKFVAVFLSLSLFLVNQVVFPKLSVLYAENSVLKPFKSLYFKALAFVFCYGLAAVVGFAILGRFVLELFYLRGKINAEDLDLINRVLNFYSMQIPFYLSGVLAAKVLSVLKLNRFLMYISMGSLFLNITLNYVFMNYFGAAGVALATSVVYLYSFVFMMIVFFVYCGDVKHEG